MAFISCFKCILVLLVFYCVDSTPPLTVPLQEYVTIYDFPAANAMAHRHFHVTEYFGQVAMGDPPQYFNVVFDTGSGNIVLPTAKCESEACQKHHRFVSADSHSSVQLAYDDGTLLGPGLERDTTTITYGTGKLTGEYIRDAVCMGPANDMQACTTVDFLGVTQESRFPFTELPFDGIFGLGLVGLSAGPNFNFVGRLKENSTIRKPVFGLFLRSLQADEDSELTFGGYSADRLAKGDDGLTWLPVPKDQADQKGYWLVTMREVYVRGQALGICSGSSAGDHGRCEVAMDTGSSLMMGPRHQVNTLLDAIGDCSGPLPTLRFVLDAVAGGTFDMVLTPEDYAEVAQDNCAIGIQPIELPPSLGPMWVFGQTVLRKYYSVYDSQNWRIGVGEAKHSKALRAPTVTPASSASAEYPVEACEDDNKNMAWNHLPGCQSFAAMGYCKRFVPLAQRYCRLSCEYCTPRGVAATANTPTDTFGESVGVPTSILTEDVGGQEDATVVNDSAGFRVVAQRRGSLRRFGSGESTIEGLSLRPRSRWGFSR